MFADAVRQVRYHPGRVIATLIAIIISIGFMAAISTFLATERDAIGKQLALPTSKADVVVTVNVGATGKSSSELLAVTKATAGVQTAENLAGGVTSLTKGNQVIIAAAYPMPNSTFLWSKLKSGSWPTKDSDIAIAPDVAKKLGVAIGGTIQTGPTTLTVTGITADPKSLTMPTVYLHSSAADSPANDSPGALGSVMVRVAPGSNATAVRDALRARLSPFAGQKESYAGAPDPLTVNLAKDARQASLKGLTGDFDVMRNMLLVFGGIALLVGMIIIANTFTILLAQRRRQIGLLRAVGATTGQVRGRFFAEAVLLGMLGSLGGLALGVGLAAASSAISGALYYGMSLPWAELGIEFAVGVVITVLAAMAPIMRTSRVLPLEALQSVSTTAAVRRHSVARAVICGLFAALGAALVVLSFAETKQAIVLAVLAAMLLTIAVLGAAPLYIPPVIGLLGHLFGRRPVSRLAVSNTLRNPGRAATTATALMLAVGLIVTLQVGTATVRRTMINEIDKRVPIDLSVTMQPSYGSSQAAMVTPLPDAVMSTVKGLPNIRTSATLDAVMATWSDSSAHKGEAAMVTIWSDAAHQVSKGSSATVADDEVLTSARYGLKDGTKIQLKGEAGTVTLTSRQSRLLQLDGQMIVSAAAAAKLGGSPQPAAIWISLADRSEMAGVYQQLTAMAQRYDKMVIDGAAFQAESLEKVLDVLLWVVTGLLGVAVLVALVGVANTLSLSVIERRRESALLRALGMQRGSLRLMLLIEALLLALAGVVVGILAGCFFGWLGISALTRQMQIVTDRMKYAIDIWQTLGMVAIAVAAACLASILPGRKAALAPPTEALADE